MYAKRYIDPDFEDIVAITRHYYCDSCDSKFVSNDSIETKCPNPECLDPENVFLDEPIIKIPLKNTPDSLDL